MKVFYFLFSMLTLRFKVSVGLVSVKHVELVLSNKAIHVKLVLSNKVMHVGVFFNLEHILQR
jgi:hypothetical protein